jgi:hypothetical protein
MYSARDCKLFTPPCSACTGEKERGERVVNKLMVANTSRDMASMQVNNYKLK